MYRQLFPLLLSVLFASPFTWGQESSDNAQATRQPTGLGRGRADTPRYFASSAAATRAIAICSGLWSGNQTMEDIDFYSPLRSDDKESFTTEIDRDKKFVAIHYAEDMPPRYVVWRPVLGCTQLPVGATFDSAKSLPQVASTVRAPNLDNQPWPTGDVNAEGKLPTDKQTKLNELVAKAFADESYGGTTWGVIVVKDGKIVAEQYAVNFDKHKGAPTHSAAKSFASGVVGIAVEKYASDIHKQGA